MKLVIRPQFKSFESFIKSVPSIFEKEGRVIYQERNILKILELNGLPVVVKSFHKPFFFNGFIYGFLRDSKAERSYNHATILMEKGINTPEPIAYMEQRKGGRINESYFISVYKDYPGMMRELRSKTFEEVEPLLKAFAHFTASVHEKDVLHQDYSPGNILYDIVDGRFEFALIDINRMKFGKVGIEAGCHNLCRLWGNNKMIAYIAKEYAICRGLDTGKCVQLSLHYHQEFWRKYGKSHNGMKPTLFPQD